MIFEIKLDYFSREKEGTMCTAQRKAGIERLALITAGFCSFSSAYYQCSCYLFSVVRLQAFNRRYAGKNLL